jgi:hypothetical protein
MLIYKLSSVSIRAQILSIFKTSTPLIFGVVLFYLADLQNMGTRIASAMIFFVIYIVFAALIKNQGFIYIQNTIKEMRISLNKNVSIE